MTRSKGKDGVGEMNPLGVQRCCGHGGSMIRFLQWISRHASAVLVVSVFLALLVPEVASLLYPLIGPAVWLVLFLSVIRIDLVQLAYHGRRPGKVVGAVVWLAIGAAVLIWVIISALDAVMPTPVPGAIKVALILNAAAPPLMSSPAIAFLVGLDAALVLIVVTVATLVMPLVAPGMVQEFLGLDVGTGTLDLMARLGGLIVSATCAGLLARRFVGGTRIAAAGTVINGLSVLILVFFAIAMMNGVTARMINEPVYVMGIAALAFATNVGLQVVGAVLFARLGRREALSIGLASGNRAMALWVAVLPAMHPDVFLYFAMAQFPIYLLPAIMARVYQRLLPE